MVYQWKTGSRIKGDAQKSGELFEQLSASERGLTAESLLDANKPEDAPLHNDYEWSDEKAALEYRLHQSRHFLNSIVMVNVSESTEETPKQQRAFFITTEQHKYDPITHILQVQSKYERLLDTAFSELIAFKRKYYSIKELKPVFEAIEKCDLMK